MFLTTRTNIMTPKLCFYEDDEELFTTNIPEKL